MTSELHHYRECGLDNIFLLNGFTVRETRHGRAVSIEDIDGLHRAIGTHLAKEKRMLTGAELRFLRVELGLSQKLLGMLLGKTAQTVARWEKGQSRIDGTADRMAAVVPQADDAHEAVAVGLDLLHAVLGGDALEDLGELLKMIDDLFYRPLLTIGGEPDHVAEHHRHVVEATWR